jgi:hypothetical protein
VPRRSAACRWRESGRSSVSSGATTPLATALSRNCSPSVTGGSRARPARTSSPPSSSSPEHLESRLELFHHPDLAQPLEAGDIADWNVCDWYATKALHGYLSGADDVEARARAIAAWTLTDRLWQRRAGLVAFVRLAPVADRQFDGFIPLILEACAANLVSDDRFAHTGPGWVLRELSVVASEAVTRFVEDHPELSTEGRLMATARLRSGTYRRR